MIDIVFMAFSNVILILGALFEWWLLKVIQLVNQSVIDISFKLD